MKKEKFFTQLKDWVDEDTQQRACMVIMAERENDVVDICCDIEGHGKLIDRGLVGFFCN